MLCISVEAGGDADKNVRTLGGRVVKSVRERTRGGGGVKSDYFERTYFLDDPYMNWKIIRFIDERKTFPVNENLRTFKS